MGQSRIPLEAVPVAARAAAARRVIRDQPGLPTDERHELLGLALWPRARVPVAWAAGRTDARLSACAAAVLELHAASLSVSAIAQEMDITVSTVVWLLRHAHHDGLVE